MRPRALLVALAALAVAVSTGGPPGTAAVSGIEADRDVSGRVVEDERAYLGVVAFEDATATGTAEDVELFEVSNRLRESVRLSATAPDAERLTALAADDGDVGTGATTTVAATVDCDGVDEVRAEVRLTATGESVEVRLFRTVTVDCVAGTTDAASGPLAVDDAGQIGSGGDASRLTAGTVRNRGSRALRVDVSVVEPEPNDDPHVDVVSQPDVLAAGESDDVLVDVDCGGDESEVVTLTATGTPMTADSNETATASGTFVVDCDG